MIKGEHGIYYRPVCPSSSKLNNMKYQKCKAKILTLCLLTFFISSNLFSQTTKENAAAIENLGNKIELLEDQKANLDRQSELLKENFDGKATALENKFEAERLELDRQTLLFGIISGVLAFFGLASIYLLWKRAIKKVEEEVNKKVGNLVEEKRQDFVKLIKDQELETRLKNKNKILVVTKSEKDRTYLENFFEEAKIKQVSYEVSDTYQEPDSNIDLIVFDDHNNTQAQHDLFREYIDNLSKSGIMFIFFGGRLENARHENLNFSNSKFTLYNHIITALKFRAFER